jgi:hypothetical protein
MEDQDKQRRNSSDSRSASPKQVVKRGLGKKRENGGAANMYNSTYNSDYQLDNWDTNKNEDLVVGEEEHEAFEGRDFNNN